MDVDAVLRQDPDLLHKIRLAQQRNFPIDGHAPLLSGPPLLRYSHPQNNPPPPPPDISSRYSLRARLSETSMRPGRCALQNIYCLYWKSNPDSSVVQSVA
jgi:hypothetical protein